MSDVYQTASITPDVDNTLTVGTRREEPRGETRRGGRTQAIPRGRSQTTESEMEQHKFNSHRVKILCIY